MGAEGDNMGVEGAYPNGWGPDGPLPSAPPMGMAVGVVDQYQNPPVQQPAAMTEEEKMRTLGMMAVDADRQGDTDKALRLYESTVHALQAMQKKQTSDVAREKLQAHITQYSDRMDGIKRNKRRLKASASSATPPLKPIVKPVASSTTTTTTPSSGWDGQSCSGKVRGLYDAAIKVLELAKIYEGRGNLLKTKECHQEVVTMLVELLPLTQGEAARKIITERAESSLSKAEELDKRIKELNIQPPKK